MGDGKIWWIKRWQINRNLLYINWNVAVSKSLYTRRCKQIGGTAPCLELIEVLACICDCPGCGVQAHLKQTPGVVFELPSSVTYATQYGMLHFF